MLARLDRLVPALFIVVTLLLVGVPTYRWWVRGPHALSFIQIELGDPMNKETEQSLEYYADVKFNWEVKGHKDESATLELSPTEKFVGGKIRSIEGVREITTKIPQGEIFWRVLYRTEYGQQVSSEIRRFRMQSPSMLQLVLPGLNSNLSALGASPIETDFEWTKLPEIERYKIQVSREEDFKSITVEQLASSEKAKVMVPTVGDYYWRVFGLNEKGDVIRRSGVSKFTLK